MSGFSRTASDRDSEMNVVSGFSQTASDRDSETNVVSGFSRTGEPEHEPGTENREV